MKKGLLIVAMMIGVTASAQEMKSKKGTPILPEAGDWSIGTGATAPLNYIGDVLDINHSDNSSLGGVFMNWTSGKENQIVFKKMKTENIANRFSVRWQLDKTVTKPQPLDPKAGFQDGENTKTTTSKGQLNFGYDYLKYRGKGRVRGYYGAGAEVQLGDFTKVKTQKEWKGTPAIGSLIESKDGNFWSLGVKAIIGVEYFFAPKMSLGGEFSWKVSIDKTGLGYSKTEGSDKVDTGEKSRNINAETENANANLSLNFYF